MRTTPILLALVAAALPGQVRTAPQGPTPAARPAVAPRPMFKPLAQLKVDLLPVGKTQGTFHVKGLVRKDRTVVLRWGNSEGEMPTEGVRVFRLKVGDSDWKDLTGRKPVGFLQGRLAEKAFDRLKPELRENLLAFPFGDVTHDPATRLRIRELPKEPPKGAPREASDLSMEKSLTAFKSLRGQGRLSRQDLRLMHAQADMDENVAGVLGLTYTDDPGRGEYRYKIQIALPEGGLAEVVCPTTFDTRQPTPIPQPVNLTAASGNGEVLLNWDETPSEVITGYNIYRAESPTGPWKLKLNSDAVKKVELELEDPETTLRRSIGIQSGLVRKLRPLPEAARTPQKIQEAYTQTLSELEQPNALPPLSAATSKSIKDAVTAGRLRPGGKQAPKSIFTDSIRIPGNALQTERTYYYKVTAVDIGGLEQSLDSAPVVEGVAKDLEPPTTPGRPRLTTETLALRELNTAQTNRLQDVRLVASRQAILAKLPKVEKPFNPTMLPVESPVLGPAPTPKPLAGLSLAEVQKVHLSNLVATAPVGALKKVAEAAVLRSNPDGTVPPAKLTWEPATEPDLKGYEVYRAIGTGPMAKVADVTAPEWTDATLEAGQAYRYAIASVDKLNNVSARSAEGKVEVSDSRLPGRLAVPSLSGAVAKDMPTLVPVRRLLRPVDRIMPSGRLGGLKAKVAVARVSESLVADFQAPKATVIPKVQLAAAVAVKPKATKPVLAAELVQAQPLSLAAPKAAFSIKPLAKALKRTVNLMALAPTPSKEIHVSLTWAKPLQGFPMEYVVQQAPQRMETVTAMRPALAPESAFSLAGAKQVAPQATLKPLILPKGVIMAPAAGTAQLARPTLAVTPALHASVLKGVVATQGNGLHAALDRKNLITTLKLAGGPGTFTRLNETPIGKEGYGVTFPAEVAQYGGASFFFRIQASTKEFGRTVEGPQSAPIEVRLPDIVPPPSPLPVNVDLQEGAGKLLVGLEWNQAKVPDLAGVVVERQPMTYTMVEGEAKAGVPLGPVERLTPDPVKGAAYTDAAASPGYQRYTLRSLDATGNLSDPQGFLDILIPGEPVPGAPTGLTVTGSTFTWQAGADTAGYTVWRSFTGAEDDWQCISGILPASQTSFTLPPEGTLHLRVVGRSTSGMHGTASATVVRTP